jgi:hypothetical protein
VSTQPEALRLADALDSAPYSSGCTNEAAAELRRLHVVNAELLDALRWTARALHYTEHPAAIKARAAIAKAEEVKP